MILDVQTDWASKAVLCIYIERYLVMYLHVSPCCRLDQAGSLQVDSGDPVTARSTGHLTQLNTQPALYLGN